MDEKGHADLDAFRGRAVPNVTDWQYLNLNYVAKARIDQDLCIHCGRCFAACEDTSHQAIAMLPGRVFEVKDDECVACNLCVNVCPVEDCITMVPMKPGEIDPRTGKVVQPDLRQLDHPPEQPDGEGGGIGGLPARDRHATRAAGPRHPPEAASDHELLAEFQHPVRRQAVEAACVVAALVIEMKSSVLPERHARVAATA